MIEPKVEWADLSRLTGSELKRATFSIIQKASFAIQKLPEDDPSLLEIVPRLLGLLDAHPDDLAGFQSLIGTLARSTGLWNYIDTKTSESSDAFVAEAVTAPELGGVTLHREQVRALSALLSGKNLILSAPTSFGKSLLIDALLATDRYKRVAIVLPTIALLDEFRRRLSRRFESKYQIVMHPSESSNASSTIFLGTQERLIHRSDLGQLDLTVVDEFYKLDPARVDDRSVTLNAAVYRLLGRSKQFFFLGPNIDSVSVSGDSRWNFEFLRTRFSTVAVDTLDLQKVADKRAKLVEEIGNQKNWPTLVFVSSPDRANKLALELSEEGTLSGQGSEFAAWLRKNLGAHGLLPRAVASGLGLHHGRVPRAIASMMVRMFDQQKLPALLCTSTLIEGVNTAAKTVMIFDKKIAKQNYDFFTFSNIKGRAGRLGQHHVGQVMLFNETPQRTELDVSPTMFGNDNDFPDEFIIHIDEKERSPRSDNRFTYYRDQLGLDSEGLRLASLVGLDVAVALKHAVRSALKSKSPLVWSGYADYSQILAVIEVICTQKSAFADFGGSVKQLAFLITKLREASSHRQFLVDQDKNSVDQDRKAEQFDTIFKFLRACEYGLPQHFSVVELFVKQFDPRADYSLFIGGLSNWFLPEILKELDEEGIPIQISERFHTDGDSKASLKKRLVDLSMKDSTRLTAFERKWIMESL